MCVLSKKCWQSVFQNIWSIIFFNDIRKADGGEEGCLQKVLVVFFSIYFSAFQNICAIVYF